MIRPQASFDELIAQSLSHLQQIHHVTVDLDFVDSQEFLHSYRIPKFSSESIDEFLAYYRHEKTSICEFFACLDDPCDPSHSDCGTWMQESQMHSSDSTLSCDSAAEFEIRTSNTRPCPGSQRKGQRYSIKRRDAMDIFKSIEKVVPVCRRVRRKLTAQEKEERRRNQNREAQRRFREKHMLFACRDVTGIPVKEYK